MIESLPIWRLVPNWQNGVAETLEWMTDVLVSSSGAEQRRILRRRPRRFFEFDVVADGAHRALLDQMLLTHGGRTWWLPVWHDPHVVTQVAASGSTTLTVAGLADGELTPDDVAYITDLSGFVFELVEIASVSSTTVSLVSATTMLWRPGAFLFKAVRSRLVEQPKITKLSDRVVATVVKFRVDPPPGSHNGTAVANVVAGMADTYRGYSVMTEAPDETSSLDTEYVRLLSETDNDTATPYVVDTAERPFVLQRFAWQLHGRARHSEFRAMLDGLHGRAIPFWLPTFFSDFDLVEDIEISDTTLTVGLCGFTEAGGPRPGRKIIRILLVDGTSLYREVVDSVSGDDVEVLEVDEPFGAAIGVRDIIQISFMDLARLDQDAIEIQHDTDIEGVSRVAVLCRTGPEIRSVGLDGFFYLTSKSGSLTLTNKVGNIELLGKTA